MTTTNEKSPYLNKMTDEGKRARGYKDRTCLRCDATFLSWGPGNRICGPCREKEDDPQRNRALRGLRAKRVYELGRPAI